MQLTIPSTGYLSLFLTAFQIINDIFLVINLYLAYFSYSFICFDSRFRPNQFYVYSRNSFTTLNYEEPYKHDTHDRNLCGIGYLLVEVYLLTSHVVVVVTTTISLLLIEIYCFCVRTSNIKLKSLDTWL